MATVQDLYETLARETDLDFGLARYTARLLQEEGILPTGKRGGGKNQPQITNEHCAYFLLALSAKPKDAVKTVKTFAEAYLTHFADAQVTGRKATKLSVLNHLVIEIRRHRENLGSRRGGGIFRITVDHFDSVPNVELLYKYKNEEKVGKITTTRLTFEASGKTPEELLEQARELVENEVIHLGPSFTISGGVIRVIAELLGPLEADDAEPAENPFGLKELSVIDGGLGR